MGIDAKIDTFFEPISKTAFDIVFYSVEIAGQDVKLLIVLFIAAALFFTFYLGFVNFRYFCHGIKVVCGKYDREGDEGNINSFQALMTSLSGTVGLGNIAGVAVAVSVGGPGAVFWMVAMGLMSMSTKFAEVTLGVKYRLNASEEHPNKISGGPMYYLRDGLNNLGIPYLGQVLAVFFAVCCIAGSIGGGNMFQANQAFQQLYNVTGGELGFMAGKGWLFGVVLSIMVGAVIIGGIKSIAAVSSRIVPLMALIYLAAGLYVIALNYQAVPGAFALIFHHAFSLEAGLGGLLGGLLVGVQRAAFSNEAGLGSAAIVYSAAKANDPITQGMASMLGPFIDTVVICSVTALLIIVSGAYDAGNGIEGVELTSRALASGVSWFPYVLALVVFLFAYSTLITWGYLGVKCVTFLFGEHDWIEMTFKIFFCLCVIVGSSVSLGSMIDFTDAMILSMAIPNIIGLFILAPEIKRDMKAYLAKLEGENSVQLEVADAP